jgi:hypothetical protein
MKRNISDCTRILEMRTHSKNKGWKLYKQCLKYCNLPSHPLLLFSSIGIGVLWSGRFVMLDLNFSACYI